MVKDKFPNGLREAMDAAGVGVSELGRKIDAPKQNVQRWRDGEQRLKPEVAQRIAPFVGRTANALLLLPDPPASLGKLGLGDTLRLARRQRGLAIRQVAAAVGTDTQNVIAWEAGELAPDPDVLARIANAMNFDAVAFARGELLPTDDDPIADAVFVSDRQPLQAGPRDVEKLGVVAAGGDGDFEFNGKVAEYVSRPKGLSDRPGVFALEIISDSMYPAHRRHDIVFCDRADPQIGDDVVIETFPTEAAPGGRAFVKRLKRRSKSAIIVEQFNPPRDLTFDAYAVKHIWRVVPNNELHGF